MAATTRGTKLDLSILEKLYRPRWRSDGWITAVWLLALSIAAGVAASVAASHVLMPTFFALLGAGVAVAIVGSQAKSAKKCLERECLARKLPAHELIRKHDGLYRHWFDWHSLFCAQLSWCFGFALLNAFGPSTGAMIVMAALLSCSGFAVFGAAIRARKDGLALCWRYPLPAPGKVWRDWFRYAAVVMTPRRRYDAAVERDFAEGGFVNLGALEIFERGRSGNRSRYLVLWEKRLEQPAMERATRAGVLAAVFVCALAAAVMLVPLLEGTERSPPLQEMMQRWFGGVGGQEHQGDPARSQSGGRGQRLGEGSQQRGWQGGQQGMQQGAQGGQQSSSGQGQQQGPQGGQQLSGGQKQQHGAQGGQSPSGGQKQQHGAQGGQSSSGGQGQQQGAQGGQQLSGGRGQQSSGGQGQQQGASGEQQSEGRGEGGGLGQQSGGRAQSGGQSPSGGDSDSRNSTIEQENSQPNQRPGHEPGKPVLGETPRVLPPIPRNPGQVINIKLPADPKSKAAAEKGERPGPLRTAPTSRKRTLLRTGQCRAQCLLRRSPDRRSRCNTCRTGSTSCYTSETPLCK